MKRFLRFTEWFSDSLAVIAGAGLTFMMLLTVSDVVLRYLGRPIPGTYELVAFSGVVVIGFAIGYTSWARAHVFVDFLIMKLTKKRRGMVHIITRVISIGFFAMLGVCLILDGFSLYQTGEVSATLKLPFYPIALGLGVCAFTQCLVLIGDIARIVGGQYE